MNAQKLEAVRAAVRATTRRTSMSDVHVDTTAALAKALVLIEEMREYMRGTVPLSTKHAHDLADFLALIEGKVNSVARLTVGLQDVRDTRDWLYEARGD